MLRDPCLQPQSPPGSEAPTHGEQAGLDAALLCGWQQGVQPAGEVLSNSLFPSEPGDCRQTFLFTISCICLLVLSSGPEDHLAAVKKLVCVSACVCVCMCMYVCWCQCPLWVLCPGV